MGGSILYVIFVIGSIVLNEVEEMRAGWLTAISFLLFCLMSYVTGKYFPVYPLPLRCNILGKKLLYMM